MTVLKIAALLYVFIYYGLLMAYRSYLLFKQTGINAIKNFERKGIEGFIERIFGLCFVLVSVIALNYVFIEQNYNYYLIPIPYLEVSWLANLGMILALGGLIFAFIAQLQMGKSWRLGLNKTETTTLVFSGFFRFSRNPIYLGLLISYFGFFMMMPNAWSLCFLVMSYFAMEIKVRLEEQYLESKHHKDYLDYKTKVRRWL